MQIIDIRITPAAGAEESSQVRFIGEGGDEVAVTIANHHEGGATIEQELVAKAKVMLLHAAAAQMREPTPVVAATTPANVAGEGGGAWRLTPLEEEGESPLANPDQAPAREQADTALAENKDRTLDRLGE